ncbi:MAG: hypothetical protein A2199_04485 [Hydrogenophilales bacterium RIFOXYA1_FULL_63_33]|nr:MAG: hypothetical protein A2199_04485 [Hydrogenophilales bacterium RIFOXYA1_FULL_63_33]
MMNAEASTRRIHDRFHPSQNAVQCLRPDGDDSAVQRHLEASKVEMVKQMRGIRVAEPALLRRVFQQNPAVADLTPM